MGETVVHRQTRRSYTAPVASPPFVPMSDPEAPPTMVSGLAEDYSRRRPAEVTVARQ